MNLGNLGIERFIIQTAGLLRKALSGISEEDALSMTEKEIKKQEKALQSNLKKSLTKAQALSTFLEDLSDYPDFESLIAKHSHTIDTLVEAIKRARKLKLSTAR